MRSPGGCPRITTNSNAAEIRLESIFSAWQHQIPFTHAVCDRAERIRFYTFYTSKIVVCEYEDTNVAILFFCFCRNFRAVAVKFDPFHVLDLLYIGMNGENIHPEVISVSEKLKKAIPLARQTKGIKDSGNVQEWNYTYIPGGQISLFDLAS